MTIEQRLTDAASAVGILASALPDALNRGQRHFTGEPTEGELAQWAQSLRQSAPHFFPQAVPPPLSYAEQERARILAQLPPSERIARHRREHPTPPVQRRPQYREPSPEELRQWEHLPAAERLTKYREACREG